MVLGEQTSVVLILLCFSKEVIKISKHLEVIAKSHHRSITPSKLVTLILPTRVSLKAHLRDFRLPVKLALAGLQGELVLWGCWFGCFEARYY